MIELCFHLDPLAMTLLLALNLWTQESYFGSDRGGSSSAVLPAGFHDDDECGGDGDQAGAGRRRLPAPPHAAPPPPATCTARCCLHSGKPSFLWKHLFHFPKQCFPRRVIPPGAMLVVCRGMVGGVGLRGTDLENAMGEPAKVFQFNLVPSVRLPLGSGGHQPAGDPLQAPDRVVPHGVDRRSRQGAGAGAEVEADQRQGQEEEEADHGHGRRRRACGQDLLLPVPHGVSIQPPSCHGRMGA